MLTIENQKLLAIIDKNKSSGVFGIKNANSPSLQTEELKCEINDLQLAMETNRLNHEKEVDTLIKSHKSLANHCKDL